MTEGPPVDRPLPKIPNSTSLNEFPYEESEDSKQNDPPSRPLPIVPSQDEDEEEEEEVEEDIEAVASSSEDEMLSADSNHSLTQSVRYKTIFPTLIFISLYFKQTLPPP